VRQPRWWRWIGLGFGGILWAFAALCIAEVVVGPDRLGAAIAAVVIALFGLMVAQPSLSSVRLTPSTLEVCNWPFRYHVTWGDVVAVERRWTGSVVIRRRGTRRLGLRALTGNRMYDLSWRDSTVAQIHGRAVAAQASPA